MATTTTNFGWDIPQSTDLVKDGATAIAALGQDIDTAMVDLKGGTTGQVLAKASGTDLDFSWVAQDDSNAIQNAIVDAKGDLISATAADTPARLAVGTNGQFLTADSTAATGLAWTTSTSGGMTVLASGTLTGSQVNVTSINQTYKNLQIIVRNLKPATDGAVLNLRIANDSATRYYNNAAFAASDVAFPNNSFQVGQGQDNSSAQGLTVIDVWDYANTTTWKIAYSSAITNSPTTPTSLNWNTRQHAYNQTGAISEINFLLNTGNFTSGEYFILGVK
jgi:hypothetical protein